MKTRIVKTNNHEQFVPQWSIDGVRWMEFFGFEDNSPYLHVRSFKSKQAAAAFLTDPSIVHGEVLP